MAFIQVQQSVVSHRKTLRLARRLNLDRYAVVGRLVALWNWCRDNAPDGRLGVLGDDIDAETLAGVMGWPAAMGTPDELMDSLVLVGLLDVEEEEADESGQRVTSLRIHGWRGWVALADDPTHTLDSADASHENDGNDSEVQ